MTVYTVLFTPSRSVYVISKEHPSYCYTGKQPHEGKRHQEAHCSWMKAVLAVEHLSCAPILWFFTILFHFVLLRIPQRIVFPREYDKPLYPTQIDAQEQEGKDTQQ
jgi:hypothetical protein